MRDASIRARFESAEADAERVGGRQVVGGRLALGETVGAVRPVEQICGQFRAEIMAPAGDGADSADDLVDRAVLEHVTRYTQVERRMEKGFVVM